MASDQDGTLSNELTNTPILDGINSPRDLKTLSIDDLKSLAQEIRDKIIATASVNGGHLAPHLGVVDLTIALHYVFDTDSDDMLVWDVGHQCYAHKLLTGRRDQLPTIRKKGGLSGYPKRCESPYDVFGVGHSSTSISAALGMAVARNLTQQEGRGIAVIGDGAITAGMAFEAMSNAGHLNKDLIVILNDNNMSISKNVGAISAYFNKLITGGLYSRARGDLHSFMERMLPQQLTKAAERLEHSVKGFLMPGTMFEAFGFRYFGPIDGHDMETLVDCLTNLKRGHGPVFFHVVTKKGKGYSYAEEDPLTYHGVQAFDVQTGKFEASSGASAPTFTNVFADALIEAAHKDPRVVAITAAMPTGTGLSKFEKEFPDRMFDVGICEQHAVTFGAGLATQGLKPVCAIYSTFLQRGYDQLIHDVCLQNLPVVFAIDRAGAVGEDSPTQQGAFDISFLRLVPSIKVCAPRDDADLRAMLHWALAEPGATAIRYARSKAPTIGAAEGRDITRGEILREGTDATIVAIGPVVGTCLAVAQAMQQEGYSVGVVDARWIKPLDTALMERLRHMPMITVEENTLPGGFGAAIIEHFADNGMLDDLKIKRLGFPDRFLDHATREEQLAEIGLDPESIASAVRALVGHRIPQSIS
ncbi:MAG TPA: 1-deoxy-D-xylulose-5-phosphate synthase [Candidatus Hydrogenedentes bacterium]|nr:1-deoxy-D-xylulose-5-phosphate synthase [Candidatus Hydrogenedentota bacterium]HRK33288.1 1-deoxy-D-xylulose-5-phosphate synthase [Candidatus Hydrogenedentota bacterium]